MTNNKYIDLSLIKNQNELVTNLSKILTIDDLEELNLSKIKKLNRSIDDIKYTYYSKELSSGKSFKIIDTLMLDIYPSIRYISIKINIENKIDIEFKFKYTRNTLKNISTSIDKTYNYLIWKDPKDSKYFKGHIINNFSKFLSNLNLETLEELKFIIDYLTKDGSINKNNDYSYPFSIDGYSFIISSNPLDTIKFTIRKEKDIKNHTIYFHKNRNGLSDLDFIIDRAISLKR